MCTPTVNFDFGVEYRYRRRLRHRSPNIDVGAEPGDRKNRLYNRCETARVHRMSYNQKLDVFEGYNVVSWPNEPAVCENKAIRVQVSFDWDLETNNYVDGPSWAEHLQTLAQGSVSSTLKALVIGPWSNELWTANSEQALVELISLAKHFNSLEHLFVGDIVDEEMMISELRQCNMTPILNTFPQLQSFYVRGSNELRFENLEHASLQKLVVQSGGLAQQILSDLLNAQLPSLRHLELLLGTTNYGGTITLEDLLPLFSGRYFDRLHYLGIKNSEFTDDIAQVLAQSPLLSRIKTLDLSLGTLGDEGVTALLKSPYLKNLESVVFNHHFVSDSLVAELRSVIGDALEIDETLELEDYTENGRYIDITE